MNTYFGNSISVTSSKIKVQFTISVRKEVDDRSTVFLPHKRKFCLLPFSVPIPVSWKMIKYVALSSWIVLWDALLKSRTIAWVDEKASTGILIQKSMNLGIRDHHKMTMPQYIWSSLYEHLTKRNRKSNETTTSLLVVSNRVFRIFYTKTFYQKTIIRCKRFDPQTKRTSPQLQDTNNKKYGHHTAC